MINWSRGKCAYPSAKLTDHAHGPIASPAGILNASTMQITQTPQGRFVRNPSWGSATTWDYNTVPLLPHQMNLASLFTFITLIQKDSTYPLQNPFHLMTCGNTPFYICGFNVQLQLARVPKAKSNSRDYCQTLSKYPWFSFVPWFCL